jgi:hypothetical protein
MARTTHTLDVYPPLHGNTTLYITCLTWSTRLLHSLGQHT